jgi:hypothetical protein
MLIFYILLILLAAFPLGLTVWRIRRDAYIRKTGIHTSGHITSIRTVRLKSSLTDIISIEYRDRATGRIYTGKASSKRGKYKRSDTMGVAYLPGNPAKYALTDPGRGYTAMLVFCILVFLFVLFAVYKIEGMARTL